MCEGTTEKISNHVYFVHPSTDISVNISTDILVECQSTYLLMLDRYVGRHVNRHIDRDVLVDILTETSADISTDTRPIIILVDMSTENYCCLTVGRHIKR